MQILRIIILISLFLVSCSTDNSNSTSNEILSNFLTFERSFGDSDLPEEYLLARPRGIALMQNGNILVCDESALKIFNQNGEPVRIIGGRGQGPGEFDGLSGAPLLSPANYLSARASSNHINFFDPDLKYIERISLYNIPLGDQIRDEYKLLEAGIRSVIYLNPEEQIYILFGQEEGAYHNFIVNKSLGKDYSLIHAYKTPSYVKGNDASPMLHIIPHQGQTYLCMLSDSRIVFTNTGADKKKAEGGYYYNLNITDYNGKNLKIISRPFKPLDLPPDRLDHDTPTGRNVLHAYPYYPTLLDLKTDGKFIFTFTQTKNDAGEILTDIFNADNGEYIRSAYFPFIPYIIKDGKAYRQINPPNIPRNWKEMQNLSEDRKIMYEEFERNPFFPRIEIYKIDPDVFK
ncbi:hypothetical protein ACFL6O_02955 [candidate division KSB1 bacterium]